ncbi:Sphingolipid C4-hydroxylase sur2 [Mucor circinelloides]
MNTTAAKKSSGLSAGLSLDPWSDELMAIWVPIAVYWIQCSIFEILMRLEIPFFEKYRIHSPEDRNKRNKVGFGKVLLMVALQHVVQIVLGIALMKNLDPAADQMKYDNAINRYTTIILNIMANLGQPKDAAFTIANNIAHFIQNYMVPCVQFFTAMVIVDTHQYVLHRLAHTFTFMYKYMHSHHHRLYVPYAFGALYNHPLEGFLLDTCGAAIAFEVTGMSAKMGMWFFTFSTLKTIGDHCGYAFPWDPLTVCFGNNVKYHDIHHQAHGIKTNFAQPFFTFWDVLLHTEYSQVMKAKAEAKAAKNKAV